jgi:DNA-binding transcriptional LysR family regulator
MELRHLRYFIAVAEELHFAKAASRLHIAQPSLSKQIQRLEQELGFPLFYRTKQRVELLDAGHVLLDEARRILREPFVVALPDSHPPAKQNRVSIKTLAGEPFILPPHQPGWDYSDAVFQILEENSIKPRIAQVARQVLAVASLVAGGLGVALVPASLCNLRLRGLTYRPIKGRSQTSDLTMVWRQDSRAATLRAFLDVVRAEYPKN